MINVHQQNVFRVQEDSFRISEKALTVNLTVKPKSRGIVQILKNYLDTYRYKVFSFVNTLDLTFHHRDGDVCVVGLGACAGVCCGCDGGPW